MLRACLIILSASAIGLPPARKSEPVPGYDWTAPRKRAPGKPAPPPRPASEIVAALVRYVQTSGEYEGSSVAFIVEQEAKTAAEAPAEFPVLAYSVLSKEFERGLNEMDGGAVTEAAATFEALSASADPFLAVTAANLAATALIEMDQVDRCQAMLERVAAACDPIEQYTTSADHFRFMLGYCQVHNLMYREAYATFEDFLKNHPDAPERLVAGARQILTELDRRAPGRIGDVRDIMMYAQRKLRNERIDDDLVDKQYEAVALLDGLIEEAEEQEQQGQGGGEGGSGRGGGSSGGRTPGGGAQQSTLPQGTGDVGELRGRRVRPGETWGKMPPRDREELLQTLQKQFPSQYRELLEQYYKQLARDAATP